VSHLVVQPLRSSGALKTPACFITPVDRRWKQLLAETQHDVYHTPDYATVAARQEDAVPVALYAEHGSTASLVPLLLRQIPEYLGAPPGWLDAVSPYGYPGPLITGKPRVGTIARLIAAWKDGARDAGIISMFIRSHPLIPLPASTLRLFGKSVRHGDTVYIDLRDSQDEIWRSMRENHKSQIRRLVNGGFTSRLDQWQELPEFIALYLRSMVVRGAAPYYFFSKRYFVELREALGAALHLCTIHAPGGELASAGLFTETGGIVQYHLGCSSDDFRRGAPSKLMFHDMQRWAAGRGNRFFHLGGGVGCQSDSQLFQFKAGFSPRRAEYWTFRTILDKARYGELVRRRSALLCEETPAGSDFFPLYRYPTWRTSENTSSLQAALSQ
jgi:hypothetical protein